MVTILAATRYHAKTGGVFFIQILQRPLLEHFNTEWLGRKQLKHDLDCLVLFFRLPAKL